MTRVLLLFVVYSLFVVTTDSFTPAHVVSHKQLSVIIRGTTTPTTSTTTSSSSSSSSSSSVSCSSLLLALRAVAVNGVTASHGDHGDNCNGKDDDDDDDSTDSCHSPRHATKSTSSRTQPSSLSAAAAVVAVARLFLSCIQQAILGRLVAKNKQKRQMIAAPERKVNMKSKKRVVLASLALAALVWRKTPFLVPQSDVALAETLLSTAATTTKSPTRQLLWSRILPKTKTTQSTDATSDSATATAVAPLGTSTVEVSPADVSDSISASGNGDARTTRPTTILTGNNNVLVFTTTAAFAGGTAISIKKKQQKQERQRELQQRKQQPPPLPVIKLKDIQPGLQRSVKRQLEAENLKFQEALDVVVDRDPLLVRPSSSSNSSASGESNNTSLKRKTEQEVIQQVLERVKRVGSRNSSASSSSTHMPPVVNQSLMAATSTIIAETTALSENNAISPTTTTVSNTATAASSPMMKEVVYDPAKSVVQNLKVVTGRNTTDHDIVELTSGAGLSKELAVTTVQEPAESSSSTSCTESPLNQSERLELVTAKSNTTIESLGAAVVDINDESLPTTDEGVTTTGVTAEAPTLPSSSETIVTDAAVEQEEKFDAPQKMYDAPPLAVVTSLEKANDTTTDVLEVSGVVDVQVGDPLNDTDVDSAATIMSSSETVLTDAAVEQEEKFDAPPLAVVTSLEKAIDTTTDVLEVSGVVDVQAGDPLNDTDVDSAATKMADSVKQQEQQPLAVLFEFDPESTSASLVAVGEELKEGKENVSVGGDVVLAVPQNETASITRTSKTAISDDTASTIGNEVMIAPEVTGTVDYAALAESTTKPVVSQEEITTNTTATADDSARTIVDEVMITSVLADTRDSAATDDNDVVESATTTIDVPKNETTTTMRTNTTTIADDTASTIVKEVMMTPVRADTDDAAAAAAVVESTTLTTTTVTEDAISLPVMEDIMAATPDELETSTTTTTTTTDIGVPHHETTNAYLESLEQSKTFVSEVESQGSSEQEPTLKEEGYLESLEHQSENFKARDAVDAKAAEDKTVSDVSIIASNDEKSDIASNEKSEETIPSAEEATVAFISASLPDQSSDDTSRAGDEKETEASVAVVSVTEATKATLLEPPTSVELDREPTKTESSESFPAWILERVRATRRQQQQQHQAKDDATPTTVPTATVTTTKASSSDASIVVSPVIMEEQPQVKKESPLAMAFSSRPNLVSRTIKDSKYKRAVLPPKEEEVVSRKYAAIPSLEERAFVILKDLGMLGGAEDS